MTPTQIRHRIRELEAEEERAWSKRNDAEAALCEAEARIVAIGTELDALRDSLGEEDDK